VARILRPLVNEDSTILDAGCGEYGLAEFIPTGHVVGVDVIPSQKMSDGYTFIYGSIIALPFARRSFSVAASVDVLEHLPGDVRADAIRQLVSVADKTVVITFPGGKAAREMDEAFNKKLIDFGQLVPDWLTEHLSHQYPDGEAVISEIRSEANRLGRKVRTSVLYSENLTIVKFLRWAAATSRYLYILGNVAMGILMPVLPRAKKENAYRLIILAEFENA
jgi:hypothetical protein